MWLGHSEYKFFAFSILDLEKDFDQFTLKALIISLINSLNDKDLLLNPSSGDLSPCLLSSMTDQRLWISLPPPQPL